MNPDLPAAVVQAHVALNYLPLRQALIATQSCLEIPRGVPDDWQFQPDGA